MWVVAIALAGVLGWWYWRIHPDPATPDGAQPVVVRSIQDGDTMKVTALGPGRVVPTAEPVGVRLLGVDAPETNPMQCWAEKAKADLADLAPPGSRIWVIGDADEVDDSGRRLLYAWTLDGVFVNARLAESGSARLFAVPPNLRYEMEISKKVDEARQTRRGLWGACAN